jgi:hypothetical protein
MCWSRAGGTGAGSAETHAQAPEEMRFCPGEDRRNLARSASFSIHSQAVFIKERLCLLLIDLEAFRQTPRGLSVLCG